MDAFAVAICKGLTINHKKINKSIKIATYFGIFQAIMPLLGYLLAYKLKYIIESFDHWIAFALLLIIGIKMIIDAILNEDKKDNDLSFKTMIGLSIATSIDALAIGITLSLFNINILTSVLIIGIITFILSFLGSFMSSNLSHDVGKKYTIIGGLILILIGFKILFEHLELI